MTKEEQNELDEYKRRSELRSELAELEELRASEGYRKHLVPLFVRKEKDHLAGLTDRNGPREHHLEAWHTIVEIKDFVDSKISRLKQELSDMTADSHLLQRAEPES